jgi:hypothetical protein
MTLPSPGPGRPHHPGQFRQPPSDRQLELTRSASRQLEAKVRSPRRRRFNQFGLRRSARKGGRY